uniref:Uncharacterized protein n=1 Tax=Chromera velia CCMP2878 TaxID=1169474 RepID=A0A0G4HHP8_9ALVE|eukprot:Cvel_1054.t1-p1 / transcript=Cvel_1054.t1 / gene=Cvel_1054 / organism=Chromera_velia_CCMP2878 / gene_product=hypothetical protein / transcript_product=hypothetical protein / location=Cvel_scaffold34:89931-94865(+) / protein_length=592 / sequence_SO=supercontig / SO=protein_coding / is_pseudo=false
MALVGHAGGQSYPSSEYALQRPYAHGNAGGHGALTPTADRPPAPPPPLQHGFTAPAETRGNSVAPAAAAGNGGNHPNPYTPEESSRFPPVHHQQYQQQQKVMLSSPAPMPLRGGGAGTSNTISTHANVQLASPEYFTLQPLRIHISAGGEVAALPFEQQQTEGEGAWADCHGPSAAAPPMMTGALQRFIWVLSRFVPRQIGTWGKCTVDLETRSSAKIHYDDVANDGDRPEFRRVRIRGTQAEVDRATELLVNKLASWTAQDTEEVKEVPAFNWGKRSSTCRFGGYVDAGKKKTSSQLHHGLEVIEKKEMSYQRPVLSLIPGRGVFRVVPGTQQQLLDLFYQHPCASAGVMEENPTKCDDVAAGVLAVRESGCEWVEGEGEGQLGGFSVALREHDSPLALEDNPGGLQELAIREAVSAPGEDEGEGESDRLGNALREDDSPLALEDNHPGKTAEAGSTPKGWLCRVRGLSVFLFHQERNGRRKEKQKGGAARRALWRASFERERLSKELNAPGLPEVPAESLQGLKFEDAGAFGAVFSAHIDGKKMAIKVSKSAERNGLLLQEGELTPVLGKGEPRIVRVVGVSFLRWGRLP